MNTCEHCGAEIVVRARTAWVHRGTGLAVCAVTFAAPRGSEEQ